MDFKVLAVGDVVGNPGMDRVCRSLRYLKKKPKPKAPDKKPAEEKGKEATGK